jgi:hypothetical protein
MAASFVVVGLELSKLAFQVTGGFWRSTKITTVPHPRASQPPRRGDDGDFRDRPPKQFQHDRDLRWAVQSFRAAGENGAPGVGGVRRRGGAQASERDARAHQDAPTTIRLSVLHRSIRPRSMSLTRGCDAENLGGLRLRQSAGGERLLELNQEVGAHQQMLPFVGGESQISKHVARRGHTNPTLGPPARRGGGPVNLLPLHRVSGNS